MKGLGESTPHSWSGDWRALVSLVPYLMEFRLRVAAAIACLVLAKVASVTIPVAMKHIVDALDSTQAQAIAVPVLFLLLYGLLRLGAILFGEIRDTLFGRVTERAMRRVGLKLFRHLHALDLDFHLSRRTGGLARDIERGTNGISFLLRFMVFNVVPTLLEILLVIVILTVSFNGWYAAVIVGAIVAYVSFSVIVTDWRTRFVRELNEIDNKSNTRSVDSLLNFETVKYFANEEYEAREYDGFLAQWELARRRNRITLAFLNTGQAFVVAASITILMFMAAGDVVSGAMTLGDLVMVNAYLMQLFIPLNFLGFVYREIKKSMADIENMFMLLDRAPTIVDAPGAKDLEIASGGGRVAFEQVSYAYRPERPILQDISFTIEPGSKLAVVGPSGAGKSTLARLLFRFYDVDQGRITIDGQDIREVTQSSLRRAIGVVPQDTVLFNNTIAYNIGYGRPEAGMDDIRRVTRLAHLEDFIAELPEGYDTLVGERGLKLSGGEKQRIAIARMLLSEPRIMVFDEATSSLDSGSEQAILAALREAAIDHTALVIAHRLATVVDADRILVLRHGAVVEHGTHDELLAAGGVYHRLWTLQQRTQEAPAAMPA